MILRITFFCALFCCLAHIGFTQSASIDAFLMDKDIQPKQAYGLYYQLDKKGNGATPKKGDYVMLNFTAKLLDGAIFEESDPSDPFVFQLGHNQVIRGWDLGTTLFPVGSQGTLYIPSDMGYGKRGAGTIVPPNTDLIYDIEIIKILNKKEYNDYMLGLEKKEQIAYQKKIKEQFIVDKKRIQEYALNNKLRTKRTNSGLSYVITKKGKGALAQPGDELQVQYEGFLTDGNPFEKTKAAPFTFTLGKGKVIDGWEEGLQFFNQGSEGILLVPSKLAYGPRPIYEKGVSVPANSVLIFNIKILNLKEVK